MAKNLSIPTAIADLSAISRIVIPAQLEKRPATAVLPDYAVAATEPKDRSSPVALSDWPVLLSEDEAEETHLTRALVDRRWYRHQSGKTRTKRVDSQAKRYHPDQPFLVLVIDANALPSEWHVLVLKDFYQHIKPAASGVPGYPWRDVVRMFVDYPEKCRAFAEVVFNQPAEMLTPRQIRTLLDDVVSQDSVERFFNTLRASEKQDVPVAVDPAAITDTRDNTDPLGWNDER